MTESQSGLKRDPLYLGEQTPKSVLDRKHYIYTGLRETVIALIIGECPDRDLRAYANDLKKIDATLAIIDSQRRSVESNYCES